MNTPRFSQQHTRSQHQGNAQQGQPRSSFSSPSSNASRRAELLRERLLLQRRLEHKQAEADALGQKWFLWHQERAMLDARRPLALAQAAGSLLGLRLPPVARTWMYQSTRLNQERWVLESRAVELNAQLAALVQEIALLDSEIGLLAFS